MLPWRISQSEVYEKIFKNKKIISNSSIDCVDQHSVCWHRSSLQSFYLPLGWSLRYAKSCFSTFSAVRHRGVCLSPCCRDFDLHSLKCWSVVDVFAFTQKAKSSNQPSIAADSSECIWPPPDKAWVYIQSDSAELFEHTHALLWHGAAWMGCVIAGTFHPNFSQSVVLQGCNC